jgi:hypothetical protein
MDHYWNKIRQRQTVQAKSDSYNADIIASSVASEVAAHKVTLKVSYIFKYFDKIVELTRYLKNKRKLVNAICD